MPAPATLTAMEQQAIRDARKQAVAALQQMGLLETFYGWTEEQFDYFIFNVWQGIRTSMLHQSNAGEIPF